MTPRSRRPLAVGAGALLTLALLTGCADEQPTAAPTTAPTTQDSPATATPDSDADTATATEEPATEDTAATTAPGTDEEQATTAAPDAAGTTAQPAEPEVVSAVSGDFEVTLPTTWENAIDLVDDEGIQLAAKAPEQVDGFYSNIIITEEEYVSNLTSAVEETAKELAGEDGTYELLDPVRVDGNTSPGYSIVREVQGMELHHVQRWISNQGTLYVVTLSTLESEADEVAPLLDDLLASWTWTK
ncbi:hypothetical protein ACQBAT_11390 [Ornithinimicrobium sp. Y1847]|uniref:hypothetical protein n=1 Tax=unclassified Ornithinimicrobium TaxID=2615080 RepID=UPI003B6814FB